MTGGRKAMPWDTGDDSRTPRQSETRETGTRAMSWQPASKLPEPDPRPGFVHRWVRVSIMGEDDITNFSAQRREHWEPCQVSDYQELAHDMSFNESKYAEKGLIEIGGLVLCRMPEEIASERNRHFSQRNQAQIEGVDSSFLRDNRDSRTGMKTLAERSTRVSFGSQR